MRSWRALPRSSFLRLVAGVIALEQRGNARAEATAAEAQRLGARALLDEAARPHAPAGPPGSWRSTTRCGRAATCSARCSAARLRSASSEADHATILSAAVNPDGSTLAVGNIAGEVMFFDTRTRRRVATLEPAPNEPAIEALGVQPGRRSAWPFRYTSVPGATAERPRRLAIHSSRSSTDAPAESSSGSTMPKRAARSPACSSRPTGRTLGVTLYYGPVSEAFGASTRGPAVAAAPRVPFELPRSPHARSVAGRGPARPWMLAADERRVVVVGEDGITVRDAATVKISQLLPPRPTR